MLIVTQESNKNFSFSIRILWKKVESAREKKKTISTQICAMMRLSERTKKQLKGNATKHSTTKLRVNTKYLLPLQTLAKKKARLWTWIHGTSPCNTVLHFNYNYDFYFTKPNNSQESEETKKKLTSKGIYKRKNKRKIMILTRWFN